MNETGLLACAMQWQISLININSSSFVMYSNIRNLRTTIIDGLIPENEKWLLFKTKIKPVYLSLSFLALGIILFTSFIV